MKLENCERIRKGNRVLPVFRANIDGVECWIPEDSNNRDYRELMKQQQEGKIVIVEKDIDEKPIDVNPAVEA